MATPTYIPIAEITLAAASPEITITNITQDYTDIVLTMDIPPYSTNVDMLIRFNSDISSNYHYVLMQNDSGSELAYNGVRTFVALNLDAQKTYAEINIMDYSNTSHHKSILNTWSSANRRQEISSYRYASTSAITSISLLGGQQIFPVGSRITLQGIAGEAA
jgi:hypothetical protein